MEPAFSLKGVTVEFNKQAVVDVGALDFAAGKIHALIGPSGAGKSTLLRVLNLLQKPTNGEVAYFGQPLLYQGAGKLATQRTMAMVFQKPAMFSGNVYYNVALGLRFRRIGPVEVKTRVANALEMVGLQDFAKRSALTLSGGEAQRTALARALVVEPRVLLLDEPTANLDPANVAIFEEIINRVHRETGATIIMVTHNLYQARRVSQETVFINKGKIIEANSTIELFIDPQVRETKLFISGEMVY